MIAYHEHAALARSKEAFKFVRDGYRVIRGRAPKHTIAKVDGSRTAFSTRRQLMLQESSVSEIEWELLRELVKESANFEGPIIEVGVLAGRTTQRLALYKAPHQKIMAIDNFCWNDWGLTPDEQWGLVSHSLNYLVATQHVEICRIDKNQFYEEYTGVAPSLVFLDAMHDYEETKNDILWARRIGAKIICGHDYKPEFPGVIKIVDELGGPRRLAGSVFVV